MHFRTMVSKLLSNSPVAYFPVRIRHGLAKGAWWTLLPFSANWRLGGAEADVSAGLASLPKVEGIVFWDFGAHFGIHTVGVAIAVGIAGQVVAFEPDPVAFSRLARHVRMNRLSNVILYPAGTSDKTGTRKLIISDGMGSAFSHFMYEDESPETARYFTTVRTVAADDLVKSGEIRLPDLIKIDVQGHGDKAVRGALQSIRASRPVIAFSNHSPWELSGTRSLLEPLGYSPVSISGIEIKWEDLGEGLLICRQIERPS